MSVPGAEGGEGHPLLHRRVRDIASRGEGVLTAVVHEWHGGRLLRIAYLQPATGVAWTTAVDNIRAALGCGASPCGEAGGGGEAS
ncbi:hypothetical protein ASE09_04290 [Streptomyces sp. Root66D1]|nr:hypothetical protein ASD33_04285 [Streptomyces sp. Root1304]KRB00755.1 hypothetical protein ASE09_04290 [Streptomyces sp. Root66D1]